MKKISTLSKLSKYSMVSSGALLAATVSQAAIIYTDLDPDENVTVAGGETYELDLDADGNPDFLFSTAVNSSSSWYAVVARGQWSNSSGSYGNSKNDFVGYSQGPSSDWMYVSAVPMSNAIDSSASFLEGTGRSDMWLPSLWKGQLYGDWNNRTDNFIGVRFDISGDTHYGWIRASSIADRNSGEVELTIHDYAYNDVADEEIFTGEGGLSFGIYEVNTIGANLYTSNGSLVVNFEEVTTGELTIASLNGSVVFADKVNTTNYTTSLNNLTSGMYIVNVKTEKGMITKKITL